MAQDPSFFVKNFHNSFTGNVGTVDSLSSKLPLLSQGNYTDEKPQSS